MADSDADGAGWMSQYPIIDGVSVRGPRAVSGALRVHACVRVDRTDGHLTGVTMSRTLVAVRQQRTAFSFSLFEGTRSRPCRLLHGPATVCALWMERSIAAACSWQPRAFVYDSHRRPHCRAKARCFNPSRRAAASRCSCLGRAKHSGTRCTWRCVVVKNLCLWFSPSDQLSVLAADQRALSVSVQQPSQRGSRYTLRASRVQVECGRVGSVGTRGGRQCAIVVCH